MDEKITSLKNTLSQYKTEDVLGMISLHLLPIGYDGDSIVDSLNLPKKTVLKSPMRQYLYLCGLLVSTGYDPESDKKLNESLFKRIEDQIAHITDYYIYSFAEKFLNPSAKFSYDKNVYFAAFEGFDSYFNTGNLSYPEQTENKILKFLSPFDDCLYTKFGFTAKDAISFSKLVCSLTEKSLKDFQDTVISLQEILEKSDGVHFDIQKEIEKKKLNLICLTRNNIVSKSEIESALGTEKTQKLFYAFSIERQNRDFSNYTDANPFVERPIVKLAGDDYFITYPSLVVESVYNLLNSYISQGSKKNKIKTKLIEDYVLDLFKSLLNQKGNYYQKVCERPGTDEHDILIEYNKYIFIIEVKGSKTKKLSRNIDDCAKRIRDHFFSDCGIGYAYEQCEKLRKHLESSNPAKIYIEGNEERLINTKGKKMLSIVITLENFGKNQINMSSLLQLEPNRNYPWSCCIDDLENILKINRYLGIAAERFVTYIRFRIKYHSQIFASDELEILEEFYLNNLKISKDTNYFIEPKFSSLIDKIYFEEKGVPYEYKFKMKKIQ